MGYLPPALRTSLRPVGRLDKDTEGLLLFTDDGDLLHRLISPKKQVPKVYFARHEGDATEDDVAAFAAGLVLKDGTVCLSAKLEPLGHGESLVTVCEGKYHQVRRMLASRGHFVTYLERRSEGPLSLGDLPRGWSKSGVKITKKRGIFRVSLGSLRQHAEKIDRGHKKISKTTCILPNLCI